MRQAVITLVVFLVASVTVFSVDLTTTENETNTANTVTMAVAAEANNTNDIASNVVSVNDNSAVEIDVSPQDEEYELSDMTAGALGIAIF
jgi:superfamily II RNA helicase